MGWLSAATVLMKLVNLILGIVDKEKMLNAGEARNVSKAMEELDAEIGKANGAISALRTNPAWLKRVRELGDRDSKGVL